MKLPTKQVPWTLIIDKFLIICDVDGFGRFGSVVSKPEETRICSVASIGS
jgi:hypothetical protein